MGIKGSVLRQCSQETRIRNRGEVPYGLDTALYHGIRYLLGYFDRYRQHAYIDIVLLHLLFELVRVIDGDAAQCRTHQFGLHIESSYYLQTEMAQTRVAQQGTSSLTPNRKAFVYIGKSQEILQHSYQCVHLSLHCASRDIDIRKVFGNLEASILISWKSGWMIRFPFCFNNFTLERYHGEAGAKVGSGTFMVFFL